MTRTLGAGLTAHLGTGKTRLARCVVLDLVDGTSLGITDHDRDLTVSFGSSPAYLLRSDVGAIPSAIQQSIGFETDSMEVSGPIGSVVTQEAVMGGRYRGARARVFDVNWSDTSQIARLLAGKVSECNVDGGRFRFSVRSHLDAYNQVIGRVITPYCSHDFGVFDPPHSRCQATPLTWDATVTAVTDALRFEVSWDAGAPTAANVRNGEVEFTSGALAGTRPVEVFDLTGGDALELYHLLVEAPQVGDTLTVKQGCAKTRTACKAFDQILNNGGFPDAPGSDKYLPMPTPGG